nr:MAG TPA: High frequency of lysogenization C protein [Herelleviridae sp.]
MKKIILFSGLGILLLVGITSILLSVYTVNTGEVYLISRFGKIVREEKEGLRFINPFIEDRYKFEIRDVTYNSKFEVSTKDLQSVTTQVAVQYRIIDPVKIYRNFGTNYKDRLIVPRVAEIVQSVSSDYTIEQLVSDRTLLSQDMYKSLKEDLGKFGIMIVNVSIVDHDFSDEFDKAVESKKSAEQLAQKQEVENNQKIKTAEANLKVKELEAKANSILTESLSDKLLRKQAIEKWNGELPRVSGNDKLLFNITE